MSKAYEFLKECGVFFVITVNGDCPAGRPFGAIMEDGEYLYIATNDFNKAHAQLRLNGNVQLVAKKEGSREWIRVSGVASECGDGRLIDKMFEECPVLHRLYPDDRTHFLLFRVSVSSVELK